jgi:hypothetical protein
MHASTDANFVCTIAIVAWRFRDRNVHLFEKSNFNILHSFGLS